MNCPICDKKCSRVNNQNGAMIFLDAFRCSDHYYANVEPYSDLINWEVFTYGKYKISRQYEDKVITKYSLYFPMIKDFGNCLKYAAEDINFDPQHPENVLNKLKTIVNFS